MHSNHLASHINAILLSLQLRDDEKLQKTKTLLHYADKRECLRSMPMIFHFLDTYDSQVAELCIKVLMQMFYRHQETVVAFFAVDHVYSVFRSDTDDMLGGELVWRILRWKAILPNYPFAESKKIMKLLLRRSRQHDPRRIPCSALRWWLVLLWRDFPIMRPVRRGDSRTPSPCVPWLLWWLASSAEPVKFKVPLLQVLVEEVNKMQGADIESYTAFTACILQWIFEAVPVSVGSGHLQLIFHFLDMKIVDSILCSILQPLDSARLVTVFALLLTWTPVALPKILQSSATSHPADMFLSILCVVIRGYRRRQDPALTGTCLRLIAALGCADENVRFAITLLGLVKMDFPNDPVWEFSMPPFLDAAYLRFGADRALSHSFVELGYDCSYPHLDEPKVFEVASLPVSEPQERPDPLNTDASSSSLHKVTSPPQIFVPDPIAPQVPANHEIVPLPSGSVGLRNYGNTCYLGATIQALSHTDSLVGHLFSFNLARKTNPNPVEQEDFVVGEQMLRQFKHLIGTLLVTDKPYVGIDNLIPILPAEVYVPNEQADPSLTLRYIFDKFGSYEQMLVRTVFTGEVAEHLQCQVCKTDKEKKEYFSDLVVTVPKEDSPNAQMGVVTIQALLNKRFEFEVMTGEDQMFCDHCQTKRDAGKWSEMISPPQHLVLSMGRITFDLASCDMVKFKTYVEIQPSILVGGYTYELYFVIYHQGASAHSGHYLGIGRRSEHQGNQVSDKWFHFDDSKVQECQISDIQELSTGKRTDDSPYVLFYRCSAAPLAHPPVLPSDYVNFLRSRD